MAAYRKYFYKVIKAHFPNDSTEVYSKTNENYKTISIDTQFSLSSSNPLDKRLDFSAYFLSLIKTLDEQGESFERIRSMCLEAVTAYVKPKNKIQQALKRIPSKLMNTWVANKFLKLFDQRLSKKAHPKGFVAKIITDKKETFGLGYGFDILECGICKLFKKHNYQKYSSILCEVDEITSRLAGLTLVRNGTIALGAKKCDFRFKKEQL